MKEQIETRLRSLTDEFRAGQEMLADLEAKRSNLEITLSRISGAIQVLKELLEEEELTSIPLETAAATTGSAAAA